MSTLVFDTLEFSKALQGAGFEQQQADALARAQKSALDEMISARELATKADILRLETRIEENRRDLLLAIAANKHDILRWVLGVVIAQAALFAAVLAYVK